MESSSIVTVDNAKTESESDAEYDLLILNSELREALSINNSYSTPTSPLRDMKEDTEDYVKIGAGACGAIFARPGSRVVFKVHNPNGPEDGLYTDFAIHRRVAEHIESYGLEVKVPACYGFKNQESHKFWRSSQHLVMATQKAGFTVKPTLAIHSERIPPLPRRTQILLIERFCHASAEARALKDEANRDCLVRVYLGSVKGKYFQQFFSLRNFKLYLNHMLDLEMDVDVLARQMAMCLAVMHWSAHVDARDVEFVLGSFVEDTVPTSSGSYNPSQSRRTALWLLDFNQVRHMTMDEAGVAQAIEAHDANYPYYPRPLSKDKTAAWLWKTFSEVYLETADAILGDNKLQLLPRLFLEGVIEKQRVRLANTWNQSPFLP